jgi:hypothetical protein
MAHVRRSQETCFKTDEGLLGRAPQIRQEEVTDNLGRGKVITFLRLQLPYLLLEMFHTLADIE